MWPTFEAYNWQVLEVEDGNDLEAISKAIVEAKADIKRPTLIIVKTQIGYGCPAKQGKASAHGEPLGVDNIKATKENLGFPTDKEFYVPEEVSAHLATLIETGNAKEDAWDGMFTEYKAKFPEKRLPMRRI